MIVPNLIVTDMAQSVAFYRDILGFTVKFAVTPDRTMAEEDGDAAFTILEWDGAEIMLQTEESLNGELSVDAIPPTRPWGTVYLRGMHPKEAIGHLDARAILKGPETTWYGMNELYVRDPDGHILCIGAPEGPAPE